jgi:hypothetical protein
MAPAMKTALFYVFHLIVSAYAILLCVESVNAWAQPIQRFEIGELERRVASMETLNLDHRLTIIETKLEELITGKMFDRMTMGGTGLLIAERVVQALRKRKEL